MPEPSKKDLLRRFLKGIETGDAMAAAVVDETRYIQHNPQTGDSGVGLAELFARLAKTNPKVRVVRVFEDGDFAFAHTEYDFASLRIGFEVFRFDGDRAVEHWDNIQPAAGPNRSGRGMTDGPVEVRQPGATETTRALVRSFVEDVLIASRPERLAEYVAPDGFAQHAPDGADGIEALRASLAEQRYDRLHRVLAEGEFALCACEGHWRGAHAGLYDLYRVEDGRIVEQWTTREAIPDRALWKNTNGKF